MVADTTGKVLQLLDLVLEFFADEDHWIRDRYGDGRGRRCLVGAVRDFGFVHALPQAPVISLLEAALPQRQLGLIHFNDHYCRSAAELRSVILKARALALENAEYERTAAALQNRLLDEVKRDRAARRASPDNRGSEMAIAPQRLAA